MNYKKQRLAVKLLCCVICLVLLLGAFSACKKQTDPLTKTGISSVTLDKKERVCVEVTLDRRTVEERKGETLALYELLPGEGLGSLSSKEPLDEKKVDSAVSFRIPLMDGERSRLYSSFAVLFEDGSSIVPYSVFIENPVALATGNTRFTWQGSPKALVLDDVEHALDLGVMHAAVDVSLAELALDADGISLSESGLGALDAEIGAAADAGMQVTLRILSDPSVSKELSVALIDGLAARYADKVSAHWIGVSGEALSAADAAYLCRVSYLALSSRSLGTRVYLEAPKASAVDAKAFFSDVMISLDNGGKIEWGAALMLALEEELMMPDEIPGVASFVMNNGAAGKASRFAVSLPEFSAKNEEAQAVRLAYSYRLALSAGAGLILYPSQLDDESGICSSAGEERLSAEVFSTLDTGLSEELDALCRALVGDAWTDIKTPSQISRTLLSGISNVGVDGLARTPIFDFSNGDTQGFVSIGTMDPLITRESAAWGKPVLYAWLDPSASQRGGIRRVLDEGSIFSGVSSLTVHLLSQAKETDSCTAVLTLEGMTPDGDRITYRSDVSIQNGEWQTVTFEIGRFAADLDPSAICTLSLTVEPESDTEEPYVLWVKGIDARTPERTASPYLPLLLILGAVAVTFAIFIVLYAILLKKRARKHRR